MLVDAAQVRQRQRLQNRPLVERLRLPHAS
jgi:hypothetical protein